MSSRAVFRIFSIATLFLGTWLLTSVPARAGTISITYSFTGGLIPPPVITGGFVHVNGAGTGSVNQWNPLLNAVWNPVTFDTMDHVSLATGLNNGSFNMTFADGSMLSGMLFEDDSMVNLTTGTGPFTQTLAFAAGTGGGYWIYLWRRLGKRGRLHLIRERILNCPRIARARTGTDRIGVRWHDIHSLTISPAAI